MSNEIAAEDIAARTKKLRSDWIEIDANLLARLKAIDHIFCSQLEVDPNTEIMVGYICKKKFCISFILTDYGTPVEYDVTKVSFSVLVKSAETLQKAIESIEEEIGMFIEKVTASQRVLNKIMSSPLF